MERFQSSIYTYSIYIQPVVALNLLSMYIIHTISCLYICTPHRSTNKEDANIKSNDSYDTLLYRIYTEYTFSGKASPARRGDSSTSRPFGHRPSPPSPPPDPLLWSYRNRSSLTIAKKLSRAVCHLPRPTGYSSTASACLLLLSCICCC